MHISYVFRHIYISHQKAVGTLTAGGLCCRQVEWWRTVQLDAISYTSEHGNVRGETGGGERGWVSVLKGWSCAASHEGQTQLDWRRCGHFRHGSTSFPLQWACKPCLWGEPGCSPSLPSQRRTHAKHLHLCLVWKHKMEKYPDSM